ncbi:MAG: VOC family protein [Bacteroidota bacterium]
MKKAVVHFEIGCNNISGTADFYKKVFGWDIVQNGNSATIDTGRKDAIPGHLTKLAPDEPQKYINIYIETDSIEEDLIAVEANGGKGHIGPIALPDGRSFAWFQDVAGNTVGLITTQKNN